MSNEENKRYSDGSSGGFADGVNKSDRSDYAFSEKMYVLQRAIAYFISIATSGAYLAKLTTGIGISDSMTAILSSISSLACIFQFLSIPLSHKRTFKGTVISTMLVSHVLLGSLYLIPFFGFDSGTNSALFFFCILVSYIFLQIGAPLNFTWFMSLPHPSKRGRFQSVVEMFSRASGLVFSFVASYLLDHFTKTGQTEAMFITFTSVIFVLSLLNCLTLAVSKEKPHPPTARSSFIGDIKRLMTHPGFLIYVAMYIVYAIAFNTTGAFLGTYMVKDLGFSMVRVTALSLVNAAVAILSLAIFGNLAGRRGLSRSILTGFPIYAVSFLCVTLATPSNGFIMMLLYNVLNPLGNAGVLVGMEPILFETVPGECRASAISLKNVIAGLFAFSATFATTPLLNYIQASGNRFLGISMYAQQLFGVISCVLMLVSMLLFRLFIGRARAAAE